MFAKAVRFSAYAATLFVLLNFALYYAIGTPLLTDRIAEWIMARTPNQYAVAIMDACGEWAKPFAATGGLAAIGFAFFLVSFPLQRLLRNPNAPSQRTSRRAFLTTLATPVLMPATTAAVALESYARDRSYARRAASPTDLWPFRYPSERESFAPQLVRKAVTPVDEFYGMSKNTVDPVLDPREWRLAITLDGRPLKSYTYAQILSLPRFQRFTTMRCVSNTLNSNLMGTAEWSGVFLRQLIDPGRVPGEVVEVAFIGIDGHDDSLPISYAFSEELMLALGMNGKTLNRVHGFPFRLIAPKYYGFKSVKWLSEVRLVTTPYYGTWPKMGYTKEPVIHTMSYIDRIVRDGDALRVGGVSFAGVRGIDQVQLRADSGEWVEAQLEAPITPHTWTRWKGTLFVPAAGVVEARAMDGGRAWQATKEKPLFPDGVSGPTRKRVS